MSPTAIALLSIVFGAIVCFFGYAQFRIILALVGLVYGYMLGFSFVGPDQEILAIVIGVIVGLIVGALAYFLWTVAFIIGGAILGFGIGWLLGPALGVGDTLQWVLAVVLAVVVAVLFLFVRKPFIMMATAINGAGLIVSGLGILIPSLTNAVGTVNPVGLAIWLVLAVVGFIVQLQFFSDVEMPGETVRA